MEMSFFLPCQLHSVFEECNKRYYVGRTIKNVYASKILETSVGGVLERMLATSEVFLT